MKTAYREVSAVPDGFVNIPDHGIVDGPPIVFKGSFNSLVPYIVWLEALEYLGED